LVRREERETRLSEAAATRHRYSTHRTVLPLRVPPQRSTRASGRGVLTRNTGQTTATPHQSNTQPTGEIHESSISQDRESRRQEARGEEDRQESCEEARQEEEVIQAANRLKQHVKQ